MLDNIIKILANSLAEFTLSAINAFFIFLLYNLFFATKFNMPLSYTESLAIVLIVKVLTTKLGDK